MRRFVWLAGLLAIAACQDKSPTSVTNPPPDTGQQSGNKAPQFIVVLQPKTDAAKVAKDHGITPTYTYSAVLSGFAGKVSDAAKAGLLKDSRVVSVEKDQDLYAEGVEPAQSWGLDRIDQRKGTDGNYSYTETGKGVTAYILDTGIRYTHHDFGGRASFGFDAYGGDGSDCLGHGTHVAGIVGGTIYGVAKDIELVSVRVLDCEGSGTTSSVLAGLDWVLANARRPAVVNMSLSGDPDDVVDDAIRELYRSGIPTTVAAGNSNADACSFSPARVPEAITVAASSPSDDRTVFSNYGDCVDFFAPGLIITSDWFANDTARTAMNGTSMAAPHAAGVAALFLQRNPTASAQQVADALASWTTKRIIHSANTRNNDLLYSMGDAGTADGNATPVASFTSTCSALSCGFTDASTDADGTITAWEWDFGDGTGSTEQNPTHSFPSSGTYGVTLTATDNGGASGLTTQSISLSDPAGANAPPTADFTYTCAQLTCDFSDASQDPDGSVVSVEWDFGDGTATLSAASATHPHTFPAGASYEVSLTATDDGGASQTTVRAVPVGVVLTLVGYRQKGHHVLDISWVGATSDKVDVYVADQSVATVDTNSGDYVYASDSRGQGTYAVRVCEAGTAYCSRTESVTF